MCSVRNFTGVCEFREDSDIIGKMLNMAILPVKRSNMVRCTGFGCFREPTQLFVCLGFNGTFSTNRPYRAIAVG